MILVALFRTARRAGSVPAMTHPPPLTPKVRARVRTRLAEMIDDRGIPVARLARRAGVSKGTVHRLLDEDDVRDVHLGTLVSICAVLRIDVAELLAPLAGEEPDPV